MLGGWGRSSIVKVIYWMFWKSRDICGEKGEERSMKKREGKTLKMTEKTSKEEKLQ